MTFKEKWDNYWYYYKFHTIFGLFIVIVLTILTIDFFNTTDPDLSIGYIGATYINEGVFSRAKGDIENIVGDINGDGETKIYFDIAQLPETIQNQDDIAVQQKVFLSFVTGDIRIYLLEERFIDQYKEGFQPLDEILSSEKLEGGIKSDGKTIAVRLDKGIFSKSQELNKSKLYACVRTITETDKSKENIDEIFRVSILTFKYIMGEAL